MISFHDQTDEDYFLLEFSWHFLFYVNYYIWKTLIFSHDAVVVHGLLWTIFSQGFFFFFFINLKQFENSLVVFTALKYSAFKTY